MKSYCQWLPRISPATLLAIMFAVTGLVRAAAATDSELVARMARSGFTAEQAQRVVGPVTTARKAGLPAELLILRIDEGLAKQAPADAMERAIQARLQALQSAKTMLADAGYSDATTPSGRQLHAATALALESGVPFDDLRAIVARGNGGFTMRMTSVVEAGESLHLAGIGRETVGALMLDCLDRSLGRMEILRVVTFCIQRHRDGTSDAELRTSLWGSETNNLSRGAGGMRNGQGRGTGKGPQWNRAGR